jgi:hypothetical protein
MKQLLLICAVVALVGVASGHSFENPPAEKKTDAEKDGYKGKVHEVKRTVFNIEVSSGKLVITQIQNRNTTTTYDPMGMRLIKTGVSYIAKVTHKYDEKGNVTESVHYGFGGEILIKNTFKYNEKERLEEILLYGSNGKNTGKNTLKYDKKGRHIESVLHDVNGNFLNKYTYDYDERGNGIETVLYDASGKISRKTTSKHDKKGNMVESLFHDASGKITGKVDCKYDEKGNKIKERNYESKPGQQLAPVSETIWEFTYYNDHNGPPDFRQKQTTKE